MKKLILLLTILFAVTFTAFAQDDLTKTEKYEKYYQAKAEMDFRNYVLDALDLSAKQIKKVDPIIREYMNERVDLSEQKLELVEEYRAEMAEDDREADEREETSDFIENFWEASIEEIELKENYFDRFENVIPYEKALAFFMLEDEAQYQILRNSLIKVQPWILKFETYYKDYNDRKNDSSMNYDSDESASSGWSNNGKNEKMTKKSWSKTDSKIYSTKAITNEDRFTSYNAFVLWVNNTASEVSVKHKYTSEGLNKLSQVFVSMWQDGFLTDTEMVNNKIARLNTISSKLQDNWTSTKHADWAREAFMITVELFETAQANKNYVSTSNEIMMLSRAARDLESEALMTAQASDIYDFFNKAKKTVEAFTYAASNDYEGGSSKRK